MGWPARIAFTSAVLAVAVLAAPNRLECEVASVKASSPGSPPAGGFMPLAAGCRHGNLWSANNVWSRWLIEDAHKMSDSQILGLPGWVDGARFDIEARVAPVPGEHSS
ncbi:MAG TPA: DUF3738 domain-containing protein [Verrucomicrobiae bacterium]|nr:DUF3738 domain-containing protein [Verrucomicrobiae bacterium]